MALAQQLAELALASSQGLLNDDEYRLLRQNLFEQDSNSALIPVETPILPVAGAGKKPSRPSTAPIDPGVRTGDLDIDSSPTPRTAPLRRKTSFAAGVTNFLRRAAGKASISPATPSYEPPRPPSAPAEDAKRGVIPRLHRKASKLFVGRAEGKRANSTTIFPRTLPSLQDSSHKRHCPDTPLLSPTRTAIPTFPSPHVSTSSSNDVFDDRNLHTVNDIRAAIIATETEAQRLLEAFNGLESTTSFRVHQQTARRLPSATPEHITTLIDGTEWRNYRPPNPSPLASQFDRKAHRHVPTAIETTNDGASVRSGSSSIQTSLSRSKSISSLRSKRQPASPLSARFPPSSSSIVHKNSVSSSSMSKSTGHLPLGMLVESKDVRFSPIDREHSGSENAHPEVSEIQRRRNEVMARYTARLEYLQAKLKSAELHEKLLRR